MGDRANIVVVPNWSSVSSKREDRKPVYLYTHWGGESLPDIVAQTLSRKERWNDASYLTRMFFCRMVRGEESESTGFGISAELGDNEHTLIVIDVSEQRVFFVNESDNDKVCVQPQDSGLTFTEACDAKNIRKFYR